MAIIQTNDGDDDGGDDEDHRENGKESFTLRSLCYEP